MRYITRPLADEARQRLKGQRRTSSPFSATWTQTLNLLDRELRHLGVRDEFVLQIDCSESDLRLDGQLRANARTASPAVAIAVESRKLGSLLFVCGAFYTWQDNVRAIALGLEALRKVERYGIVQSDEQYRGWQALPPGTPMPAAKMTVEEAAAFIAQHCRRPLGTPPATAAAVMLSPTAMYREAAKTLHPDVGGDPELFKKLTEARDLLAGGS